MRDERCEEGLLGRQEKLRFEMIYDYFKNRRYKLSISINNMFYTVFNFGEKTLMC